MSTGVLSLVFDAIIVMLLIATIAWAVVLNRRLRDLRGNRDELDRSLTRLVEATDTAQSGLQGLRSAAETSGTTLQRKTTAARAAIDELSYLAERGNDLARRLEAAITAARGLPSREASTPAGPAPARVQRKANDAADPQPHQERLLKALQGMR